MQYTNKMWLIKLFGDNFTEYVWWNVTTFIFYIDSRIPIENRLYFITKDFVLNVLSLWNRLCKQRQGYETLIYVFMQFLKTLTVVNDSA